MFAARIRLSWYRARFLCSFVSVFVSNVLTKLFSLPFAVVVRMQRVACVYNYAMMEAAPRPEGKYQFLCFRSATTTMLEEMQLKIARSFVDKVLLSLSLSLSLPRPQNKQIKFVGRIFENDTRMKHRTNID